MTEEENVSVESQAQTDIAQAAESEPVVEKKVESQEEKRKRNDAEYNWAEARRKTQELERQNREMSDQLARLQQNKSPEVDELDALGEGDIVSKAQAKKLAEKMARQIVQESLKQQHAATAEERARLKFPDYDDVVTKENIELLKQRKPELALSLAHNPDPHAQAVAVYDALKMMGSVGDPKMAEKKKAAENLEKPRSVNAVTKQSAIGQAHLFENGLTPEVKKQIWKEMQQAMKAG